MLISFAHFSHVAGWRSERLQDAEDSFLNQDHDRRDGHVGDDVGGVDALDLVFSSETRPNQVIKNPVEDFLLASILEQPLSKIAERGMVEGPFVDLRPKAVLTWISNMQAVSISLSENPL